MSSTIIIFMTIAAAFLCSDGVVFGADSTTTVSMGNGGQVGQLLNHAQKVFEIGKPKDSRMGLCIWNNAFVGELSHRTVAARLSDRITSTTTVADAADILTELVQAEAGKSPGVGDIGYFLGGWDPESHLPKCFEILFTAGIRTLIRPLGKPEARFQGAPVYFDRIYTGIDPGLQTELKAELCKVPGMPPGFETIFDGVFGAIAPKYVSAGSLDLPIREAIDLLHSYLHLTIKAFKYKFGAPICGGPIEVGFVSTDRHFRWVSHKNFDSAIVEQEGSYGE